MRGIMMRGLRRGRGLDGLFDGLMGVEGVRLSLELRWVGKVSRSVVSFGFRDVEAMLECDCGLG